MGKHSVADHSSASFDSPALVQAIMDGIAEPIVVIGVNHRVQWVNHAALRQLPKEAETVSRHCFSCFHGRETPCNNWDHECPMQMVWQTQRPATLVHEHVGLNGQMHPVEILASPFISAKGEFLGIIETTRDGQEQKHREELLEKRVGELQHALAGVKALREFFTICAWCNRVCDEGGSWKKLEAYVAEHSETRFTHGICPECDSRLRVQVKG
jgi:hypothetical protein